MNSHRTKRVLNVGQCGTDHAAIRQLIETQFEARVESAADISGALAVLCAEDFDLVLVNRILDATTEEGLDLIHKMKDSEFLARIPVMLVSNFDSAQQQAVGLGAVPGFGKAELDEPHTQQLLARILTP